jgi:hypothetical protein
LRIRERADPQLRGSLYRASPGGTQAPRRRSGEHLEPGCASRVRASGPATARSVSITGGVAGAR